MAKIEFDVVNPNTGELNTFLCVDLFNLTQCKVNEICHKIRVSEILVCGKYYQSTL